MSTTTLLIDAGSTAPDAPVTRLGGLPLAPAGTEWPVCAACSGPLQFIAQVVPGDGSVLAVFMCANDPGSCQEWDAWAGANKAFVFPAEGLRAMPLPPLPAAADAEDDTADDDADEADDEDEDYADEDDDEEVRVLGAVRAAVSVVVPGTGYDEACDAWAGSSGRAEREVLGQLGGEPEWLQYDQTPVCPDCAAPMAFTACLEEGPDAVTAPNFGSGTGYLHACAPCARAAFLWQC
ncbi:hypothetical protein [Streptomyces sp. NPDC089919]|uniref:hypothetical protein n=1 Tax=Streptomyces sp. NPDC089919 TaxID=3155188 RepID=UPI003421C90E